MKQFEMIIGHVSMKPDNTQFLANNVWTLYSSKMRALHEIIRIFLADFYKHRDLHISYAVTANDSIAHKIEEKYSIASRAGKIVTVWLHDGDSDTRGKQVKLQTQKEVIETYDAFASVMHNRMYFEVSAQTVLHPVRALINNVLSALGDGAMGVRSENNALVIYLSPDTDSAKQVIEFTIHPAT